MRSTATAIAKTVIILATLSTTSDGFSLSPLTSAVSKTSSDSVLEMAKGKGFGNTQSPKKKAKKTAPEPQQMISQIQQKDDTMITSSDDKEFNPFDKSTQTTRSDTSRGKAALDKMRREKAEERNAELQKNEEYPGCRPNDA